MDVQEFLAKDRFAANAGVRLIEVRYGFARAVMSLGPDQMNAAGSAQGGAVFTLADLAFAAAANSHGTLAVTVDASISFVRAESSGDLFAEAREESSSGPLATYTVRVTNDQGQLVAFMKGTALRRRVALDGSPVTDAKASG